MDDPVTASGPDLSVVVSTYERPMHLHRCLASLSNQTLDKRRFEIIVADDGSRDETHDVVETFRRSIDIPVTFSTQKNLGFRKARAVNRALHLIRSPYVVLTDGDCIFPPDHLDTHLRVRQQRVVWAGNSVFLDRETSEAIDVQSVNSGTWQELVPKRLPRAQMLVHQKAKFYQAIRHGTKPKLVGNNIGVWRNQLLSVNGFDQSYQGWGCEDDDLGLRLRLRKNRIKSLLGHTHAYHLWHPVHTTKPDKWDKGPNVSRFLRPLRLSHCLDGMTAKPFKHLCVQVHAESSFSDVADQIRSRFTPQQSDHVELEILFESSARRFSGNAECNVLVAKKLSGIPRALGRQTGLLVQLDDNSADSKSIADQVIAKVRQGMGIEPHEKA